MADLGYESHNQILNLGSLAIFLCLYFLKLLLYLILLPISLVSPRLKPLVEKVKEGLFFRELLALLIEAYLEMLISTYLQFKAPLRTTNGELSAVVTGYICIVLILVFLPIACIWILSQPIERIKDDQFKNTWEDLYSGLRTRSKWEIGYYFGFMLRRQMYVAIAFLIFH